VDVVWINQQGTINPILGAFGFAKPILADQFLSI